MSYTLFKNCSLIDASHPTRREGFHVLVENNVIQKISQQEIKCKDATVFDLGGKTLMPGLIDAHVHVTAAEIDLANEHIPISEVSIQAAHFLENMLQRGFTSVRDAGGADFGLANAINKGLIKGPRLFYCGKALSQTGGHGDFRQRNKDNELCGCASSSSNISVIADGISDVRKAARNELRKGATQIKIMASGGVASPTDKISNLQYSLEEINAIVEEATAYGTYVMAHAYTPAAIQRCVDAGVRSIEHGNLLDEKTAKLMASKKTYLVPTLVIYHALAELGEKNGFPKESLAKLIDVISLGKEAIRIAKKQGVKIGFGTDLLGVIGQTWQLKEFLLRAEVDTPHETISSATAINADLLNHTGKLGIIAIGAYADLLVVDGDPLKDINVLVDHEKHLMLIMKDGVIYKNLLL